ncbi:MAG TPA: nuclear transport factor 2 family protein [Steroidobacteraceae bacterium]|jgi:actinorhodin biosynthesis protein ActVIA|nr:nuclear transport factor 2 family protein [Steroidobacteraceae bacterium]
MNRFIALVAAAVTIMGFTRVAWAEELSAQDYIDIEQLYATYNHAIDSGDGEAWAATFTPDGTFNKFTGHDQLVGFIKRWKEEMNGGNRRHWNTNLRIVPSKDGATASVFLMLVDVSTKSIVATGMYNDTLVKTATGWRFKTRATKMDAAPPAPAAAAPKQ